MGITEISVAATGVADGISLGVDTAMGVGVAGKGWQAAPITRSPTTQPIRTGLSQTRSRFIFTQSQAGLGNSSDKVLPETAIYSFVDHSMIPHSRGISLR